MQARPSSNLRVISLVEELSDAELARIAESCSTRTYEKNAHILGEQDPTTDVFFILAGTVRANSVSPKGREVIYSEFKAGAIFGEFSEAGAFAARSARMPSRTERAGPGTLSSGVEALHAAAPPAPGP